MEINDNDNKIANEMLMNSVADSVLSSLPIPSSILKPSMPTIPIFHLQQHVPDTIGSLNECGQLNVNIDSQASLDWSNHTTRPVSRFSLTNRRECKSTSDESSIYEVNDQIKSKMPNEYSSLMSTSSFKSYHSISPVRYHSHSHGNHAGSKIRLFDYIKPSANNSSSSNTKAFFGQFGINPALFNLTRIKSFTPSSTASSNATSATTNSSSTFSSSSSSSSSSTSGRYMPGFSSSLSSTNKESHRRHHNVKRLGSSNKFGIENLNRKHCDYNHNKKLFYAVIGDDEKTVSELLESNMYDVNCCDDKQRTCLHIASSRGSLNIVRLLLGYGANANIKDCVNNLPIHLAIIGSHVPVVTVLLEAGTDINSLDLNGKTVLHLAGTRLRYLLSDESQKVSPKLKYESILIMNMIKEYLNRKKTSSCELDMLANKLENVFSIDDVSSVTKELLNKFDSFGLNSM